LRSGGLRSTSGRQEGCCAGAGAVRSHLFCTLVGALLMLAWPLPCQRRAGGRRTGARGSGGGARGVDSKCTGGGALGWKAKAASSVRVRVGFQVGFHFQTKTGNRFQTMTSCGLPTSPFAIKSDAWAAHRCNTAATPLQQHVSRAQTCRSVRASERASERETETVSLRLVTVTVA
jgi:hypothetical protein